MPPNKAEFGSQQWNSLLHIHLKNLTLNFSLWFFYSFLPCGSPLNISSWWAFLRLVSIRNNYTASHSGYPQRQLLVETGICLGKKHDLLHFRKLLLVVRKSPLSFLCVFWFARWTSCISLVPSFFYLWSGITINVLKSPGKVLRFVRVVTESAVETIIARLLYENLLCALALLQGINCRK